ncbi:MAG: hypothetical protein ACR2OB_10630 [Solirubrobacteraceae bacterium]
MSTSTRRLALSALAIVVVPWTTSVSPAAAEGSLDQRRDAFAKRCELTAAGYLRRRGAGSST